MIIDQDIIKKFAWHLKVMGAYVQQPSPAIVGLDEKTIIASNDAAALYPTGIIYGNMGFDTIRHRVYDTAIVQPIINLIKNAFEIKKTKPNIVESAVGGFKNALDDILKLHFKNKAVQNKKDAREFTLEYYPLLLRRILNYKGELSDIFEPKCDQTYYLLKSCLYPILESITWLNPSNLGYNNLLVNYVFFNDVYLSDQKEVYVFMEVNSTKSQLKTLTHEEGHTLFKRYIINPYGILFDKHEDNLAYDVELLMDALSRRRIVKNQMLVLKSITKHWDKLSSESLSFFYSMSQDKRLTSEQANQILTEAKDSEDRSKRITALTDVIWRHESIGVLPLIYGKLRASQFGITEKGIKVAANSAYGIFGLITWPYASPLIGNAITNAGKIYGIKLFQAVSVEILERKEKEHNGQSI